jgi:predicted nuclease with RNAse H fold
MFKGNKLSMNEIISLNPAGNAMKLSYLLGQSVYPRKKDSMRVIGIDLSGPSNHKDTVLVVFEIIKNKLRFVKCRNHMSDEEILKEVAAQSQINEVVIGIDAPLSYEDGGGDRESDRSLRKFIVEIGMKPSSVMPPTLHRMVYLTLRGIKLSREIETQASPHPISIVEVHPGAVIGSRLSSIEMDYVLTYKQNLEVRKVLLRWLEQQQLIGIPDTAADENHTIDACAAALGAWHWGDHAFTPKWRYAAKPPLHPYDFCC